MHVSNGGGVGALSLSLSLGIIALNISYTKAGSQHSGIFASCLVANNSPIQGTQVHLKGHGLVVSQGRAWIGAFIHLVSIEYRLCMHLISIAQVSGFERMVFQSQRPKSQFSGESK